MNKQEINEILCKFFNDYLSYRLSDINRQLEKLGTDMKQEHSDLLLRVTEAETKLKIYEALFNKLNLDISLGVIDKGDKE